MRYLLAVQKTLVAFLVVRQHLNDRIQLAGIGVQQRLAVRFGLRDCGAGDVRRENPLGLQSFKLRELCVYRMSARLLLATCGLQDQVSDFPRVGDQREMPCVHLNGMGFHAVCQKPLEVRRNCLIQL